MTGGEERDPLEDVLADTVDVAVAARILRRSERQVRDYCAAGELRAVRLHGPRSPWRVYRASVAEFLLRAQQETAEVVGRTRAARG